MLISAKSPESVDKTKTLVHALIISRLDYCNIVLYGLPGALIGRLQRLQNHAARLISGKAMHDHITPVLQALHWLPIEHRITYKVLLLAFKSLHGLALTYLNDLLLPYIPSRTLRSSYQHLLQEPTCRLKRYGARSFQYAAPRLWNQLPSDIRGLSCLATFKRSLKTFLFKKAYGV